MNFTRQFFEIVFSEVTFIKKSKFDLKKKRTELCSTLRRDTEMKTVTEMVPPRPLHVPKPFIMITPFDTDFIHSKCRYGRYVVRST